jgi:hypothetical protein
MGCSSSKQEVSGPQKIQEALVKGGDDVIYDNGDARALFDAEYLSNAIWIGHYIQDGKQERMVFKFFEAHMNGEVKGKGKDVVGLFVIRGFVDGGGKVQFTKTYIGAHTVLYNGILAGNQINGTWKVAGISGSF